VNIVDTKDDRFADRAALTHPSLAADVAMIRAYFEWAKGNLAQPELRNPHVEEPVPKTVRCQAKASAVLLPSLSMPVVRRCSSLDGMRGFDSLATSVFLVAESMPVTTRWSQPRYVRLKRK
jgi:hypothetical protein